jgi:hypothetical protein
MHLANITVGTFGLTVSYQLSTGGTFNIIPNVTNATAPNPTAPSRDATSMQSNSMQKEPVGLVDYGSAKVTFYATAAEHAALYNTLNTTTNLMWMYTWANGDSSTFLGHISDWSPADADLKSTYSVTITIDVSEVATYVAS